MLSPTCGDQQLLDLRLSEIFEVTWIWLRVNISLPRKGAVVHIPTVRPAREREREISTRNWLWLVNSLGYPGTQSHMDHVSQLWPLFFGLSSAHVGDTSLRPRWRNRTLKGWNTSQHPSVLNISKQIFHRWSSFSLFHGCGCSNRLFKGRRWSLQQFVSWYFASWLLIIHQNRSWLLILCCK